MTTCLTPGEIDALLAGTLSPGDKARAEAHLAECEKCRRETEAHRVDDPLCGDSKSAYQNETPSTPPRLHATERVSYDGSSPPPASESIEGYEVLSEIHHGGQGVVYKAVQKATKRTVAVKVLLEGPYASPRHRHRFEREIDLVASLRHPHIVTVYDSGVTGDGRHFFAMEYIHGQSLDVYLADKNLSIDQTLRLFQKICAAVNYAHQRGVIHRDLKPGNIRIDAAGEPHVLDFGLAKAAGPDLSGGTPVTVTGEFMGTLAYASPEQTKGDPNLIDIRTDVYSLGVILYEMLTGKYPYPVVGQMAEVLRNIAEAEPKKPSTIRRQINDEVETIVLKALAKEKERRYQSAENLARDIAHFLRGEPIDAKRDSTWYVIRKSLRRYRAAVAVAVAFVFLLSGSTVALLIMYRNQSRERRRAENLAVVAEQERDRAAEAEQQQSRARQEAEQARARTETEAQRAKQVQEFLQSMLASINPWRSDARRPSTTVRELLDDASERVETELADQPEVEAAVRQAVAYAYWGTGLYDQAEHHLRAVLATRRRLFGDEHPDVAENLSDLGRLLSRKGDYAAAEPLLREALAMRRKLLGEEDPLVVASLRNLAELMEHTGDYNAAESYYREALALLGKDQDREQPHAPTHLKTLVWSWSRSRDFLTAAEPFLRELLGMRREACGDEHPRVADIQNDLAWALYEKGDLAEAEALARQALAIRRKVFGDEHPYVAYSLHTLGAIRLAEGDDAGAERLLREALAIQRKVFGGEHPDVATSLDILSCVFIAQGDNAGAEALLREALAIRRKVFGDKDPRTASMVRRLADLLQEKGDHAAAEPLRREYLDWRLERDGSDADAMAELAELCLDPHDPLMRDADRALELAQGAVELAPDYGPYRRVLGRAYLDLGRNRDAAEQFEEAIAVAGENEWDLLLLAMARLNAGQLAESRRAFADAEELIEELDEEQDAGLTELHQRVLQAMPQEGARP